MKISRSIRHIMIMKTASLNQSVGALFIICLWLAGCAELAYRHMNDLSRDAWQKPKEVVKKLAIGAISLSYKSSTALSHGL
jgi:hypothetical protein